MHFSRMHTAHLLAVCLRGGGVHQQRCCSTVFPQCHEACSSQQGMHPLLTGLWNGCTPPGQTNTSKNITFPDSRSVKICENHSRITQGVACRRMYRVLKTGCPNPSASSQIVDRNCRETLSVPQLKQKFTSKTEEY